MKKVLIVSPHPDDAEFAMGGTIAKMVESGWEVVMVDLTDGEPTPFGSKEIRQKEKEKASRILGVEKRKCLGMPNRYLLVNLENRRKLAEEIRLNQPDLLFGPVAPDYHPDHIEAAKLLIAARFEAKFHKTDMKGNPHWTPRQYSFYSTHKPEHRKPTFIVDITDQWDKKIKAIQAYESQVRNIPPNSASVSERIEISCRYYGQRIGCKYGEPFISHEPIGSKDLGIFTNFSND